MRGSQETAANAELKCFDASANPYLLVGSVAAVACAGLEAGASLPAEVGIDPAALPTDQQPPRLPQSVAEAVAALEADTILREAMGAPLFEAFLAVRRAEIELFAGRTDEEVVAASRWVY
jgi:glutamine synthetase